MFLVKLIINRVQPDLPAKESAITVAGDRSSLGAMEDEISHIQDTDAVGPLEWH
jgi:hypothetical protein